MSKFIFIWLMMSSAVFAQDLSQIFPLGKGSNYSLRMSEGGIPFTVSIYIAAVKGSSLNIEYYMDAKNTFLPVTMWQQFEIAITPGQPAKILKGYVQTKELKAPEEMPQEYLKGFNGVKVNDFLFASKEELNKNKVGEDTVDVPAGKTKATHYRTSNNGQTVDYWISSEAKPIGLVKLISKSEKDPKQNYTLALISLMNNVKAFIVPANAVPLSPLGKSFLAKPESIR